jgi:hypothetical protein
MYPSVSRLPQRQYDVRLRQPISDEFEHRFLNMPIAAAAVEAWQGAEEPPLLSQRGLSAHIRRFRSPPHIDVQAPDDDFFSALLV